MVSPETRSQYTPTIGIECHVQLKTKSKLFAAVGNDAREAAPNTLISFICLGMPGALPVLNKGAVELAMKAAFALGTKPQKFSKFDRKHYFYADLPKGYQITQLEQPIIADGEIHIVVDGQVKRIGITRAHMEEDAGKSTHPEGKDYSLVDLNRAGTPLLEIVSEPDIHSAAEAKAYARELYLRMRYADVSDANLFYGNMRFDVNVSVSKDPKKLGTRSETKNLNSFKSVERAVEHEVNRQIEQLEKGKAIVQETRGWDDAKQRTFSQRSKEDAHDYRYFPDPDIPPIELTDQQINDVEKAMPLSLDKWREKILAIGFDRLVTEAIVDKGADDFTYLEVLGKLIEHDPKLAAFVAKFQLNDLPALEKEVSLQPESTARTLHSLNEAQYKAVYSLVQEGKINSTKAKNLLFTLMGQPQATDALEFATQHDFIQVSDQAAIATIVAKVLANNAQAAKDVQAGETKAIGFLVGQVMKESKGQANPGLAQQLIKKQLGL